MLRVMPCFAAGEDSHGVGTTKPCPRSADEVVIGALNLSTDVFKTSRRSCPSLSHSQMTLIYTKLLLIRPPHSTRPLPQVLHMTLSHPRPNAVYRSVCSSLPNSGFHMTWVCPCPPRCPRSFPFCILHVLNARFFFAVYPSRQVI